MTWPDAYANLCFFIAGATPYLCACCRSCAYEPVVRMLLEETLAEIGFSSTAFDNATEALTHLSNVKGDCALIIVDQGLPGGIQGAEFIRMAIER